MTNAFVFYFKGEDIKKLANDISDASDYVLITCGLNVGTINGKKVALMCVQGDSYSKAKTAGSVKTTVTGCPVPPCVPPGGLAGEKCMEEMHELIENLQMFTFE